MKRFATLMIIGLVALALNLAQQTASARPAYPARLAEAVKDTKGADAVKEQKCNACHHPKDKKKRNAFGAALNKHITKDDFNNLKDDKEKLSKKVDEALKAALKEKSPSGKTFGELVEAGEVLAESEE